MMRHLYFYSRFLVTKNLVKCLIDVLFVGLLKEYLRELPEPVFSSCLYQMLVDALGVFLPNDPDGNAKLVFSILDCLPKANRVRFKNIFT